jgi:DNA polymerase-3 subunit gamma/tau
MNEDNKDTAGAETGGAADTADAVYQVLARKYRPQTFNELIGQDALVRTLINAIATDRLAHAWLLTGVRGVGKTTTARIIARALNCTGADGEGGPTPEPCGVCDNCVAIADGRHPDILEMDAASRTGVDDVRELIEGVRYRPTSARYKVYIIDEVHMLSTNAFNALLKTLEEPPEHVKFVFATTESRKVPVTVLSRCQRFDLRRVGEEDLARHFAAIAEAEGADVDDGAIRLIARAADGSVRDGLSILDQALASEGKGVAIGENAVRAMLGLADRSQMFGLFESMMKGDIGDALGRLSAQHEAGADGESIMGDLLDLTHWLTRVKITPAVADDPVVPENERVIGLRLAEGLSMATLARAWQMLLKGLGEVQAAPQPMTAMEMVLVRIAYGAGLPTPAELVARIEKEGASAPAAPNPAPNPASNPEPNSTSGPAQAGVKAIASPASPEPPPPELPPEPPPPSASASALGPSSLPAAEPEAAPEAETATDSAVELPTTFEAAVELLDEAREGRLSAELRTQVHLVHYAPGRIEFRPGEQADRTLASRLGEVLQRLTGARWAISLSSEPGAPTIAEQTLSLTEARKRDAAGHPMVKAALDAFPGAKIVEVRDTAGPEDLPVADPDALAEEEDE